MKRACVITASGKKVCGRVAPSKASRPSGASRADDPYERARVSDEQRESAMQRVLIPNVTRSAAVANFRRLYGDLSSRGDVRLNVLGREKVRATEGPLVLVGTRGNRESSLRWDPKRSLYEFVGRYADGRVVYGSETNNFEGIRLMFTSWLGLGAV